MEAIRSMREYFLKRGFCEVETSYLSFIPNLDPNIEAFEVEGGLFLHTSPEYRMKKILAAGAERIFQFARVFRKDEVTSLHLPEFTMLEWYEKGTDYYSLMKDAEDLILEVAETLGIGKEITLNGRKIDLTPDWIKMSVSDAFLKYAKVDIFSLEEDKFRQVLSQRGYRVSPSDGWDVCFHYLFVAEVEPQIKKLPKPLFLYDYPTEVSLMAKAKKDNPRICERVELFIAGIEIMNGYSELSDANEQRKRWENYIKLKKLKVKIDEELLKVLPSIGQVAGAALGVERLLMVLLGRENIKDFLFGVDDIVGFMSR